MRKLFLVVVACCTFSMHALATNFDAKLNDIEQKINALKIERENIEKNLSTTYDDAVKKEKEAIEDKIINLERNGEAYGVRHLKARIEKKKNEIKGFKHYATWYGYIVDSNKISLDIAKSSFELINLEIKAGRTPKIPLEVAEALIKRTESQIKVCELIVKNYHARIKETEAYIKFFESYIEMIEKAKDTKIHIKNAMLRLKLRHLQAERKQIEVQEAQAKLEFSKIDNEFEKISLKFNIEPKRI